MRFRDAGGPALAAQLLIYPVTDFSTFETGSHRELGEAYFLTRAAMEWFTGHYLASGDLKRHPEVSPLLAPDLTGLPPALVITAEFDPLRDEGEAYAQRLRMAGVPVTLSRYPGMIHGFVSMRGVLAGVLAQASREVGKCTPINRCLKNGSTIEEEPHRGRSVEDPPQKPLSASPPWCRDPRRCGSQHQLL